MKVESRIYEIRGREEDLDILEKVLRHMEYLGSVGASRNILIRVDGDGEGRIKVKKVTRVLIQNSEPIDSEQYNLEQQENAIVGIYDIG